MEAVVFFPVHQQYHIDFVGRERQQFLEAPSMMGGLKWRY